MSNTEKSILLTWRNENYGRVTGSIAFRATISPYPSEAAKARVVRAYKSAGFELHSARQAWMAPESVETIPTTLVESLEALGYVVINNGVIPAILEEEAKVVEGHSAGPKV